MAVSAVAKLIADVRQNREADEKAFYELVNTLANGKKPPAADAVRSILAGAEKSLDDLEDEVSKSQRRVELRATIAAGEKANDEIPAIKEQLDAIAAVLETAQRSHDDAAKPLRIELEAKREAISQASMAEGELHRTRPERFDGMMQQARVELQVAAAEQKAAVKHLAEMKSRTPNAGTEEDTPLARQEAAEGIANAERRLQDAEAAVSAAVAREEQLVDEARLA